MTEKSTVLPRRRARFAALFTAAPLLGLLLLSSCNAHPPTPEPSPARTASAAASASSSAGAAVSTGAKRAAPASAGASPKRAASSGPMDARYPAADRLIAIGDLHGDLSAARAALRLGGAIDADDRWAGGTLNVVQTGDQIDRGDDDRDVIDLFRRLAVEASAAGGRVIALNGNHEIMNVQGDFRYVTPGALSSFAGVVPRSGWARGVRPELAQRAAAFLPGGAYALELAERDVIAVVGDSVFVHGGVLPEHVRWGIERINRETREWMRKGGPAPALVTGERGPVWMRDYSLDPVSSEACSALAAALDMLRVRRMVVGHTTQKTGISSACQDRVYRIDVGLARYYGGPIQVLEIAGGTTRVLETAR